MRDENLRQFATDRQWEVLETLWAEGSQRKAAAKLGCAQSLVSGAWKAVRNKASRQGYSPDHDMTRPVPEGFHLKGASTYYDSEGKIRGQWVKSNIDQARQEELFRESVLAMAQDIPPSSPVIAPAQTLGHLLTVYPVGDQHLGMLAWGKETGGDDYDLTIGETRLCGAMDYLVSRAPESADAAILILGDFMHYDGFAAVTPEHGNLLDADGRYPKMVQAAIRCIRYLIRAALMKHSGVRLIVEIGNHDPSSAIFLMQCFSALYEVEPRVTVDTSPRQFHCFVFGKTLVGTHHGHNVKMDRLPLLFATDWPQEWGATVHRYIHTGHIHKNTLEEVTGASVESHRILAPADAFAAQHGYRSGQGMKAIVYHREFGEVDRHTFNPRMLEAA